MGSLRFHLAKASNGGFNDRNGAGNMVDLNLKLGLPNHDGLHLSELFDNPVPVTTPSLANVNFNGPNTGVEEINHGVTNGAGEHFGINHLGRICNEDSMMVGGLPSHGLGNARSPFPFSQEMGNQPHAINLNNNVMIGTAADRMSASMLGVGGYFNTNLLPPVTLKNYTLLDSSSKDSESRNSYGAHTIYLSPQREACYDDPHKICLNPICRTNKTPMWRRGPLGPNTLCNACGIRYRKETDRRRATVDAGRRGRGPNENRKRRFLKPRAT